MLTIITSFVLGVLVGSIYEGYKIRKTLNRLMDDEKIVIIEEE